ncbi:MAG: twin-arginine translocase TatA/TatE family subunit [Actinomycetota bacterium]|nr:twin-arginine translocase TatA/TatE family subunit [Actinomycetota bacterium]
MPLVAEIIGPDILIILVIVALLFGSSRLPKLARSLGSAKAEFERGIAEGTSGASSAPASPPEERVTLTRGELDAMIAEREAKGRAATGPTSTSPPAEAP